MADLTPIPMGIPRDPRDPSLPHSHAKLYLAPFSAWDKRRLEMEEAVEIKATGVSLLRRI